MRKWMIYLAVPAVVLLGGAGAGVAMAAEGPEITSDFVVTTQCWDADYTVSASVAVTGEVNGHVSFVEGGEFGGRERDVPVIRGNEHRAGAFLYTRDDPDHGQVTWLRVDFYYDAGEYRPGEAQMLHLVVEDAAEPTAWSAGRYLQWHAPTCP